MSCTSLAEEFLGACKSSERNAALTAADPIYDAELAAAERVPRADLMMIVDSYFEGLENADGSDIPFGSGASRNESGVVTASGGPTGSRTLHIAELFKVSGGKS